MKTKRLYTWWAKALVAVILVVSAIVCGFSAYMLALGVRLNMPSKELFSPVPYEQSASVCGYLEREGEVLLEQKKQRTVFYKNGAVYDENETIDIANLSAGISNPDKAEATTYRLKDLDAFYDTVEYLKLQYLLTEAPELNAMMSEGMMDSDADYQVVTDIADLARQEPLGEKAKAVRQETVNFWQSELEMYYDYDSGSLPTGSIPNFFDGHDSDKVNYSVKYDVSLYRNPYNILYHNGKVLEKGVITNVKGETLAESVKVTADGFYLQEAYVQLLGAVNALHSCRNMVGTNAMLYVKNLNTGEYFTNIAEWESLSVAKIIDRYCEDVQAVPTYFAYGQTEGTGASQILGYCGSANLQEAGMEVLSSAQEVMGAGEYELILAFNPDCPQKVSDSVHTKIAYDWYYEFAQKYVVLFGNWGTLFFISLAAAIAMLVLMILQTGRVSTDSEIHRAAMDRFPLELLIIIDIIACVIVFVLLGEALSYYLDLAQLKTYSLNEYLPGYRVWYAVVGTPLGFVQLAWMFKHYGRRIKAKDVGGSIIRSIRDGCQNAVRKLYWSQKTARRIIFSYAAFLLGNGLCILFGFVFSSAVGSAVPLLLFIVIALAIDFYILKQILKSVHGRDEVKNAIREMTAGNLDYQVDTFNLSGEALEMATMLNKLQDGLKHAVDVQMKSERLKTDLITNVSHDIKTPLTSIINYVDILKREQIQDEKIAGYIDILDKKANRLKQLTEDLVEASKISSGNITLEMQELNLKQLILQSNGEFEEKFQAKHLELICQLPACDMLVCGDGRRMFRIIENLYNNAAKYAMPHSRIYVTGNCSRRKVSISIKNMSEQPLNFSADELVERFVRGDVSRSTEGSGLGLEIARNLTIMQHGEFDLYLDGDLFKVTLTFDTYRKPATEA